MAVRANYYKLGLFVIGALVCTAILVLIVGSGRWFTRKLTIETYFNESVQGLDIGSRLKYRGVEIGAVTLITFTYTRYQLDRPISERARYVLVEAEIEPRLLGGRAAAGDLTNPENAQMEVDKGMRVRLAPQGITGTSYLEIDYVDPITNPVLQIDWTPVNIYIPSARSTLTSFVDAASQILDRLKNLDIEATVSNLNRLLVATTDRVEGLDTRKLSQRADGTLARADSALARVDQALAGIDGRKISQETTALIAELRESNAELKRTLADPALQRLPQSAETAMADVSAAAAKMREVVADPKLAQSIARLERSLSRVDRILGGTEQDLTTTISNLRQITENLRALTEDAKRYPSNVLFGGPPAPLPRKPP